MVSIIAKIPLPKVVRDVILFMIPLLLSLLDDAGALNVTAKLYDEVRYYE